MNEGFKTGVLKSLDRSLQQGGVLKDTATECDLVEVRLRARPDAYIKDDVGDGVVKASRNNCFWYVVQYVMHDVMHDG